MFSSTVVMQSNVSGINVYDGLNISNNVIHVLNAQSADPQVILGIWENGHAHTSQITISATALSTMLREIINPTTAERFPC